MEPDEDPIPTPETTSNLESLQEDFSVYVAPKTAVLAPSNEPIKRLEPNLALVSWPLGILVFLDFVFYARLQVEHRALGFTMDRAAFLLVSLSTLLLVAAPLYYRASYFAELYEDRLAVRRGAREWATPLEDIVKVELLPCPVDGASDLLLLRVLASISSPSRYSSLSPIASFASDAPKAPSRLLHAYLVTTSFETAFWIPPFVGHEDFATAVLQQQTRLLAHRPPVVRGTIYEES